MADLQGFTQMLQDLGQSPEFARNIQGAFGRPDLVTQMAVAAGRPDYITDARKTDALIDQQRMDMEQARQEEYAAQQQAAIMPQLMEWAKDKEPSEILGQLLRMGIKPKEAVSLTQQIKPEPARIGEYIMNPKTGKYELAPGLPDPAELAAQKAALTFENQQTMLDARENRKAFNEFVEKAQSPTEFMDVGLKKPLTFEEAQRVGAERYGIELTGQKPAPKAGKAGGSYKVGGQTLTDADIQETAKKYNMSPDEVKRQLGIK